MRPTTMQQAYRDLLTQIYRFGSTEINSRTGIGITMLAGGYSFKVLLHRLPVAGNRRYWPRVAAAETAWQFMGTQSPDWILQKAPKLWSNFVEEGKLKTAYGYRWRRHFGRDQLALAMDELRDNPSNRQLYVSAWDPATDGLGGPQPKNVPCPVGFSLTRTGDDLHCAVFIRSSDVIVGLPYDVMAYALTTAAVAASCGLRPATLHVTLAHPHIYDPHLSIVRESLFDGHSNWSADPGFFMPRDTVEDIVDDPDAYVECITQMTDTMSRSEWNPLPELVV